VLIACSMGCTMQRQKQSCRKHFIEMVVYPGARGDAVPGDAALLTHKPYPANTSHQNWRFAQVYEVMLCLGMLSAILVDAALQNAAHNWRWMVGAPILPGLLLACDNPPPPPPPPHIPCLSPFCADLGRLFCTLPFPHPPLRQTYGSCNSPLPR